MRRSGVRFSSRAPRRATAGAVEDRPLGFTVLGGAVMMVVASLRPWATVTGWFGTITVAGIDGDGVLSFALGLVIGILAVLMLSKPARALPIVVLVLAGVAAALAGGNVANLADLSSEAEYHGGSVSMGIGLWLLLPSSGAASVAALVAAVRR